MINYADVLPKITEQAGFFKTEKREQMPELLKRTNDWIERENIEVINIETVVLPNMYDPNEEGHNDTDLNVNEDFFSHWYQFIRVWYRQ